MRSTWALASAGIPIAIWPDGSFPENFRNIFIVYGLFLNLRHLPTETLHILAKVAKAMLFWLRGTKIRIEFLRNTERILENLFQKLEEI
jgi:hypothetical protein